MTGMKYGEMGSRGDQQRRCTEATLGGSLPLDDGKVGISDKEDYDGRDTSGNGPLELKV